MILLSIKNEDLEANLLILNFAIFSQFGSIFFEVIHLWLYSYNGYGFIAFDLLHQLLEVLSYIIVSILLILIASGWTLKYRDFPDPDIFLPISILIITINLLIVGIGRITDDSYYKYTDYEGVPGFLLVLFRVGSCGWFIYLIKELQNNANTKLLDFLFKFAVAGSGYFLSLPLLIVFSWVLEPYIRKIVIALLINLVQILIFYFLTYLFSEKSAFYKLSTLSKSVLPGRHIN